MFSRKRQRLSSLWRTSITIDESWDAFDSFYQWAVTSGYRDDLTLDRKNNDGPYSPANCRWATYREQNRNYSRVVYVEYEGLRVPLIDLAERFGLNPYTVRQRIQRYGWTVEQAITTPSPRKATITIDGGEVFFK